MVLTYPVLGTMFSILGYKKSPGGGYGGLNPNPPTLTLNPNPQTLTLNPNL